MTITFFSCYVKGPSRIPYKKPTTVHSMNPNEAVENIKAILASTTSGNPFDPGQELVNIQVDLDELYFERNGRIHRLQWNQINMTEVCWQSTARKAVCAYNDYGNLLGKVYNLMNGEMAESLVIYIDYLSNIEDHSNFTGCGSDKDCKGSRVCENGKCVNP